MKSAGKIFEINRPLTSTRIDFIGHLFTSLVISPVLRIPSMLVKSILNPSEISQNSF
jgi:hypothetical protein